MRDRLAMRTRPPGWPIMYQSWDKLLFLHWPISAELLRPLIPPRLHIDTFEGMAWVGMTPFTMWDIRPVCFPAIPVLSRSHERCMDCLPPVECPCSTTKQRRCTLRSGLCRRVVLPQPETLWLKCIGYKCSGTSFAHITRVDHSSGCIY